MALIREVVDEQGNVLREEVVQEQSPYMTIQEAARFLRKTDHTIHEYVRQGKLKKYRISDFRTVLIKRSELEALIQPVLDEGLSE